MSPDGKRNQLLQALGFSIIAVGLAVLLVTYLNVSMLLTVPIAMLVIGIYLMITMGVFQRDKNWSSGKKSGNVLIVGSLLAVISVLCIVNYFWPGNLLILVAVALIWAGASVMLMSKKGDKFATSRKVVN